MFGETKIKTSPLTNLTASGVHQPSKLLDLIDANNHIAEGGIKVARYLSHHFLHNIIESNPEKKNYGWDIFDGAQNIQNSGSIMSVAFTRFIVMPGAKNACSVFFKDIFKHKVTKFANSSAKKFGIYWGVPEMDQSLLKKNSKEFNGGTVISCMAGEIISLFHIFKIKAVLKAKWNVSLSLSVSSTNMLHLFKLFHSVRAMMRIIILAEMKTTATDKLMYDVLPGDGMLHKYLQRCKKHGRNLSHQIILCSSDI